MRNDITLQKLHNVEDKLKDMELEIMRLPFASRLKLPISKYIWSSSIIENLSRDEINMFKPISEHYWSAVIERSRLRELLVKENDKDIKRMEKIRLRLPTNEQEKQIYIMALRDNVKRCDEWLEILRSQQNVPEVATFEDETDVIITEEINVDTKYGERSPDFIFNIDFYNLAPEVKRMFWRRYLELPEERPSKVEYYQQWKDTAEARELTRIAKERDDKNMAEYLAKVENKRK